MYPATLPPTPLIPPDQATPHMLSPDPTHSISSSDMDDPYTLSPPIREPSHHLRRSLRDTKPPEHLNDYVCNIVSFSNLPNVSQVFLSQQAQ